MTNRTTREFVAFPRPFQLRGMSRICPAGSYEIMTEEEPIGDFTYEAFRRLTTTIYVPRAAGEIGLGEIIETDPAELSECLLSLTT
jgi:hypothetical protein